MYCVLEAACVGFNYRPKDDENSINCQLSKKTVPCRIENAEGEWSFYQDAKLVCRIFYIDPCIGIVCFPVVLVENVMHTKHKLKS